MRSELGFQHDTSDHKRDELLPGREMQMPFLKGPKGVVWLIDPDFSTSARMLMQPQRETAFYANCLPSYGRRLGYFVNNKERNHEFREKTKHGLFSGGNYDIVPVHRAALQWLGDLHVAIVRCIEGNVNLHTQVHDLRSVEPDSLNLILDSKGCPLSNERNPYETLDRSEFPEGLRYLWQLQNDPQINLLNQLCGCDGTPVFSSERM